MSKSYTFFNYYVLAGVFQICPILWENLVGFMQIFFKKDLLQSFCNVLLCWKVIGIYLFLILSYCVVFILRKMEQAVDNISLLGLLSFLMGEHRAMWVSVSVSCLQCKDNGLPFPKGLNSTFQKWLRKGVKKVLHQSFIEIHVTASIPALMKRRPKFIS